MDYCASSVRVTGLMAARGCVVELIVDGEMFPLEFVICGGICF